jgi:AbrB family looped-hinge helix DNA binding protein
MTETRAKVAENGRIVIPAEFRKALGVSAGDEVVIRMEDDELRITTLARRLEQAQRLLRRYVPANLSLADELMRDRRAAARKENE